MSEKTNMPDGPKISLANFMDAAQKGNWQLVDENLLSVCDNQTFVDWALKNGVNDPNGDLRDLAVSILEKSKHKLEPEEVDKLRELMGADKNPYVRFRAAFALFAHSVRTPAVIQKLNQASEDKDVGEIARGYLSKLDVPR